MHLLIADDDHDSAETLGELLRLLLAPADIVLAFDGLQALATATACNPPPKAVIMDIEMPRMDGINAAIGIRSALGSGAPTLIAVTGHAGLTKLAGDGNAFDYVLLKPVNVNELLELLRSL